MSCSFDSASLSPPAKAACTRASDDESDYASPDEDVQRRTAAPRPLSSSSSSASTSAPPAAAPRASDDPFAPPATSGGIANISLRAAGFRDIPRGVPAFHLDLDFFTLLPTWRAIGTPHERSAKVLELLQRGAFVLKSNTNNYHRDILVIKGCTGLCKAALDGFLFPIFLDANANDVELAALNVWMTSPGVEVNRGVVTRDFLLSVADWKAVTEPEDALSIHVKHDSFVRRAPSFLGTTSRDVYTGLNTCSVYWVNASKRVATLVGGSHMFLDPRGNSAVMYACRPDQAGRKLLLVARAKARANTLSKHKLVYNYDVSVMGERAHEFNFALPEDESRHVACEDVSAPFPEAHLVVHSDWVYRDDSHTYIRFENMDSSEDGINAVPQLTTSPLLLRSTVGDFNVLVVPNTSCSVDTSSDGAVRPMRDLEQELAQFGMRGGRFDARAHLAQQVRFLAMIAHSALGNLLEVESPVVFEIPKRSTPDAPHECAYSYSGLVMLACSPDREVTDVFVANTPDGALTRIQIPRDPHLLKAFMFYVGHRVHVVTRGVTSAIAGAEHSSTLTHAPVARIAGRPGLGAAERWFSDALDRAYGAPQTPATLWLRCFSLTSPTLHPALPDEVKARLFFSARISHNTQLVSGPAVPTPFVLEDVPFDFGFTAQMLLMNGIHRVDRPVSNPGMCPQWLSSGDGSVSFPLRLEFPSDREAENSIAQIPGATPLFLERTDRHGNTSIEVITNKSQLYSALHMCCDRDRAAPTATATTAAAAGVATGERGVQGVQGAKRSDDESDADDHSSDSTPRARGWYQFEQPDDRFDPRQIRATTVVFAVPAP